MYSERKDFGPNQAAETEASFGEMLDDFVLVLKRRRWWALAGGPLVMLAGIALVLVLPKKYVSEATVAAVEPAAQRLVTNPNAPAGVPDADQVSAMTRQILSRANLVAVIKDMGLYPKDQEKLSADELAELMLGDLIVEPIQGAERRVAALKISYTARKPDIAEAVASRITSMFIEENDRMRGSQIAATSTFADTQEKQAREKLADKERELQSYMLGHSGQLSENSNANLNVLTDLRARLSAVTTRLTQLRADRDQKLGQLSDKVASLRTSRDALTSKYAPAHPQMVARDQEIARYDAILRAARSGENLRGQATDDPAVSLLKDQLESGAIERQSLEEQERQLRSQVNTYEGRLAVAPARDQEVARLQREIALLKEDLNVKAAQKRDSDMIQDITTHSGRQFRLIDPPSKPTKPVSPKRFVLSLGAIAFGLVFGIVLAMIVDNFDSSLRSEKAVRERFQIPVVVSVPPLATEGEIRKQQSLASAGWAVTAVLTIAVLSAEVYVYGLS